ncbi:hydantoinase [Cordyceps militaris]|uniref:Hydantoinase n=1 Tax=Cordyceps militaris TaxID=73501 RepID=A0A2H4SUN0_CORMI|nr:hydantoinase [Cordyceps militaris]
MRPIFIVLYSTLVCYGGALSPTWHMGNLHDASSPIRSTLDFSPEKLAPAGIRTTIRIYFTKNNMAHPAASAASLRIGVDVGGTNTDGVIVDPTQLHSENRGIIAWHKAPTTPEPSHGIGEAITAMFKSANIEPLSVASVTIGTTHFVNAVVERDASRLSKVAVLRLCGPFSKFVPPCVDWPADMRDLILGHYALLKGGLEIDGDLISNISEAEIEEQGRIIREKGLGSVVINGVFSPIDTVQRQEERAAEIIRKAVPGCDVVCSKDIANLGFLERENAAILNASILKFARHTIMAFQRPVKKLGMKCPVFITENDGTVLSGQAAARFPIRTFSSGPTNSMRGAAFLAHGQLETAAMVVDIGGTTTDVGLLQMNGFPRQQAAYSELAGIRMNFPCPDIKSIGLGGGSIVRKDPVSVGPDSVGYNLTKDAIAFGGSTLTATDCTVLSNAQLQLGDRKLVENLISPSQLETIQNTIKEKLERVIDKMKTSPEDVPVFLVGGGAIIAPDSLKGASKVIKPRWAEVANAIGAAMARVSAVIDVVKSTESKSATEWLHEIGQDAIRKTIAAGASAESAEIVEMESFPLQYINHKTRFIIRAAGDFDFSKPVTCSLDEEADDEPENEAFSERERSATRHNPPNHASQVNISAYKPQVRARTWYISETDVDWISIGCYILGTGGGGSPYSSMIRLREDLRRGAIVRVVSPKDLQDDDSVGGGGGVGSPTVGIEKLAGNELLDAQQELAKVCRQQITHVISVEIGGSNGLQSMILGSTTNMNLAALDGDWMGRAYPTQWQTTPVVFNERSPIWSPTAMADGNGNVLVMARTTSDVMVEKVLRAALSQMGSHTATADAPVTGAETKRWIVQHTISQAWRIGRAVVRARQEHRVDSVAEAILAECGGPQAGRVLFKGKIVAVERMLRGGYAYGECIVEGADVRVDGGAGGTAGGFSGRVKIPFKNENIAVWRLREGPQQQTERQEDVLGIVPDLITVIDAQNGEAIGTPEYRYGLLVIVLGLAANDKWTTSARGIELGGPAGFGIHHLKYQPLGTFVEPKSVIDEYDE